MWTLFWKYMLLALSTVFFYILFSKDKLLDKRRKGFWRKMTKTGRVYMVLYGLSVLGQAWIDYAETSSKKEMYEDLKAALAPKDRAKLSFCNPIAEMKTNPFRYLKDNGMVIKFHVCNEGNDDASHLKDTCYMVGRVGNRRFFGQLITPNPNLNSNVPLGATGVAYEYNVPHLDSPYFICMKLEYTNSKGEFPDTIRNIFFINGLDARDSYQNEFDSVKNLLSEKNMW